MTRHLGIQAGDVISIVGCGGKTSFMNCLANEWADRRVLVSTTTKILCPPPQAGQYIYTSSDQWNAISAPEPGIHVVGNPLGPKLTGVEPNELNRLRIKFDLTLLECDGSRGLPLKGWREDEPVVPDFTTLTVGVAVVWPVGKPVTEDRVFQLEDFCSISGAGERQPLTIDQLSAALIHPQGLFQHAKGRKVLWINQVEDETSWHWARQVASNMPDDLTVLAGSLQRRHSTVLRERRGV